jgi:hypothetical protein
MDKEQELAKNYAETVDKQIEVAQETGDIPALYTYTHNGKKWILTLPHSVMAQKRLLNARAQHMIHPDDFALEESFLRQIAQNAKVDGRDIVLDQLTLGEIEVLKLAYTDGLLAPLFLGGDKEVRQYMEATVSHLGK